MDWIYYIIGAAIVFLFNIVGMNVKSKRDEKSQNSGQMRAKTVAPRQESRHIVTCANCGAEVRSVLLSDKTVLYGSPIRQCPYCNKEYLDLEYREIALEGVGPGSARFDAGDRQLEEAASRQRLSDSGYIHRLYMSDYAKRSPRNAEALRRWAAQRVKPLFDRMSAATELRFKAFHVHSAASVMDHLCFEAHDAAAVTQVVKEVLAHYGINDGQIRVQVDYAEGQVDREGGTLGTFSPAGNGGTVRIVMDPSYSEYDTVVAVILHECAHAFLYIRRIRYPDTNENERFTDLAAIYMGGGSYILRGNFPPSGHRVGYLSKVECEEAQKLVTELQDRKAKQDAEERRRVEAQWQSASADLRALMASIEAARRGLHPGRVVREASNQAQFQKLWQASEVKLLEASGLLSRTNGGTRLKNEALQQAASDARALEKALGEFDTALKEWGEAEAYQMNLPQSALETVRGIAPLVEQGNAFALLEMMRFWYGCPATHRDAEVYYRRLLVGGDSSSLCALGLCSREGICAAKDEAEAQLYFRRAAALGSVDARRLLGEA